MNKLLVLLVAAGLSVAGLNAEMKLVMAGQIGMDGTVYAYEARNCDGEFLFGLTELPAYDDSGMNRDWSGLYAMLENTAVFKNNPVFDLVELESPMGGESVISHKKNCPLHVMALPVMDNGAKNKK